MAHLMGARPLARAATVVNLRRAVPDYRKAALLNTVRLALANSRRSHLAVLARRSTALHAKPKLPPAASLTWYRKPSLRPNRSMWAKPCVQVADLSFVLDRMTLDSVHRGAVDELSDSFGKLSVQDVSPSAIDELSAAFERLTLDDPVVDGLTASFGSMSLEQRSASLDDLARVFGQCSLEDDSGSESDGIPGLSPISAPLDATSTTTDANLANVDGNEESTTSGFAADTDNREEVTCLPPLSVSDFAAGAVLPLGTSPEDWLPAARSPQAIERAHLVDSVRPCTPLAWAQEPMFNVLVVRALVTLKDCFNRRSR